MGSIICENVSVAGYCSMKVGGTVKRIIFPEDIASFRDALANCKARDEKFTVAGNLSNMIFASDFYDGTVIITTALRGISAKEGYITASCGETLSGIAKAAADSSLSGFEFCYGIPGTVGGGVFMNAGAYGGEISDILIEAELLDGDLNRITLNRDELCFGYRRSIMQSKELYLLKAVFAGTPGNREEIKSKMSELLLRRKEKQPLEYPSCGSTFKRPEGHFAGALIEQCGLKGYSVGGARVSEKHAGFVVNSGNATARDVVRLIEHVTQTVLNKTGVMLEPEIRIIN